MDDDNDEGHLPTGQRRGSARAQGRRGIFGEAHRVTKRRGELTGVENNGCNLGGIGKGDGQRMKKGVGLRRG